MNSQVFSVDGFKALRLSWAMLAISIVAAAAIVAGSHWYGQKEQRDRVDSGRRLQDARGKVEAARRERDSLKESADVFRTLVDRGMLQNERRLDLVELLQGLRVRYQLAAFDYEIAPQRALQLQGGRNYPSVDILASRVKVRARALHEGDLVGFIDALEKNPRGFYPVDHCSMRRLDVTDAQILQPRVEMECTLESITLREKHGRSA